LKAYIAAVAASMTALLAAMALSSCAVVPSAPLSAAPIFYPPPPGAARLQFLTRLSSQRDLLAERTGFRDFVLGAESAGDHLVEKPYGVAIFGGSVFVVDTRNAGYAVFDLAGERTRMVRPGGAGVLKKPINIAIDADGTRFVTDTGRSLVVVFDREDRFVRTLGEPGAFRPVGIAVAAGQLYISDIEHHQVLILDKMTGSVLSKFGRPGSQAGELYQPTNIALAADGSVLVSDTGNFRIQKFTAAGRFVRSYGEIGTAPGKFARPKGVAIDHAGRMYVVDAAFENLQVLDPEGVPLLYFGAPGNARDSINLPAAVTVDYANVELFRKYAAPGFELEYVVLVACQFGANKVAVFGFGSVARTRSRATTAGEQTDSR